MGKYLFKKGNKAAKGNRGGGRRSKKQVELDRLTAEHTKKALEDHLRPILNAYVSLATGKRMGNSRRKLDPATCRHAIERFLGPAPRTVALDLQDSIESFFDKVMEEAGEGEEKNKHV